MSATQVQGQDPAVRFSIAGLDGVPGGRLEVVVIGDQAWVRDASGSWMKSPGGAADFDAAFTALSPIDLAGQFEGLTPGLVAVGSERKNGTSSRHYRADATTAGNAAAGLTAGTADLWLAAHGGYLVAFAVDGTWDVDGTPTPITLRIDVSRVNDPANVVRRPA
jgi:hypothetical protein